MHVGGAKTDNKPETQKPSADKDNSANKDTDSNITKAVKCRCFYLPKFLSAALVYAPLRSVLNRCPLDI